jgi:N-acetylglucosaminyl-diphospho-decaprenol L-rhamnosyltransferase
VKVCIVIPVFNQLHYTKSCLESLNKFTDKSVKIIIIDNNSTDGTADYLARRKDIEVISNKDNRGCAGAWNQGAKAAFGAEWVAILNNDIIVSPGWLEALVDLAEREKFDIISPAMREGEYNYEIAEYSKEYVLKMSGALRAGTANGVCFMVNSRVFKTIGFFDENFRIGQFEDTDFFRRARQAGFRLGITGSAFIHHFGSVTQKSMRGEKKAEPPYVAENRAYYRRKWKLSWWKRFFIRRKIKWLGFFWRNRERSLYGHTLVEVFHGGKIYYY